MEKYNESTRSMKENFIIVGAGVLSSLVFLAIFTDRTGKECETSKQRIESPDHCYQDFSSRARSKMRYEDSVYVNSKK